MTRFVDVSNMSDLEIKQMNQIDEDDPRDNPYTYRNLARRNPYGYRKPTNKVKINYNADDVWAAAVQAQSINGMYAKVSDRDKNISQTNRQIVDALLMDTAQITQESRDKAVLVRQYFKAYTFKLLQGKTLNEFNNTAMLIAQRDDITTSYDVAVITSLPQSYENGTKRDNVESRINFARGGYLGTEGDKVTIKIEVVKYIYSQKWNTYYVTGLTDDDKVLFFAYNKPLNIGDHVTIQGTIKALRDNSTQLNRVKVI